ncbi:MAG: hypothetical protein CSA81_12190 [Acidobacteria bacterium]|nr:MAG: hypothetical protein CSA81_12190 [Acidobacteriota bacterium]
MIGTLFAGYKIIERLGGLSNGVVFRAYDPRSEQFVAIKILIKDMFLTPEKQARFLREAQTAVILEHANIAKLLELGDSRGTQYLVMEFIEGKTFREIIEAEPNGVTIKGFVGIIDPVLGALAYAHQKGVIHRDLKPENLILNKNGVPVIVDFGLVKMSDSERPDIGYITSQGMVLGSPGYMAPEQVSSLPQDHRTDLFSIGVIMYELLCGSNPFCDGSPIKAMQKILYDDPLTLELIRPDLPTKASNIIHKCMSKDPNDRFNHAEELQRELKKAIESGR